MLFLWRKISSKNLMNMHRRISAIYFQIIPAIHSTTVQTPTITG